MRTPRARVGKAANGSGIVVARQLGSGAAVGNVFWTYQDDDGAHRRAMTVDTGGFVAPADVTVAEHLEEWVDGQRPTPQTVAGCRLEIRVRTVPHIGRLPAGQVRPCHRAWRRGGCTGCAK